MNLPKGQQRLLQIRLYLYPCKYPTNVDLGDGGTAIRITKILYLPLISSYNILPCMVEMHTTAFDGASQQAGNSGNN